MLYVSLVRVDQAKGRSMATHHPSTPTSWNWETLDKHDQKRHRQMPFSSTSTVRTIGNSSSLRGICPPILALPDGLVMTTTAQST